MISAFDSITHTFRMFVFIVYSVVSSFWLLPFLPGPGVKAELNEWASPNNCFLIAVDSDISEKLLYGVRSLSTIGED